MQRLRGVCSVEQKYHTNLVSLCSLLHSLPSLLGSSCSLVLCSQGLVSWILSETEQSDCQSQGCAMIRIIHLFPRLSRRSLFENDDKWQLWPGVVAQNQQFPNIVQGLLGEGNRVVQGGRRKKAKSSMLFAVRGRERDKRLQLCKRVYGILRAPRADHLVVLTSSVTKRLVTHTRSHRHLLTCGLRFRPFLRSDGRGMKGNGTEGGLDRCWSVLCSSK